MKKFVTSKAISKQLKEWGVKQESYFWWIIPIDSLGQKFPYKLISENELCDSCDHKPISAFISDELVEMLPKKIEVDGLGSFVLTIIKGNTYIVTYKSLTTKRNIESFSDICMSNSLGKMLIYLIENKLYEK